MVGNIVLGAPVFAGQNTGFLLMEDWKIGVHLARLAW